MTIPKTYANRYTVAKNIAKGRNFSQQVFSQFWNDKSFFFQGMVKNPHLLDNDPKETKFTHWWSTWQHEEDFVLELFLAIVHNGTNWKYLHFPRKILNRLTSVQLSNPIVNDLIFDYGIDYRFIRERQKSPLSDLDRASYNTVNRSLEIPLTHSMEFFLTAPDIACRMLEAKVITPNSIPFALRRSDKDIAKVLVSVWHHRAGIPDKLFDDIGFILDCAAIQSSNGEAYIWENMSDRLKEIVGKQQLIPTLNAYKLSCELTESLSKASNAKQAKRVKI